MEMFEGDEYYDANEELPVNFRPPIAEGPEPRRINPLPDVVLQIPHDGTVRAGREEERLNFEDDVFYDAYEELPVNFRPPIAEGAEPRRLNPLPDVVLQILHDGTVRADREEEQLNFEDDVFYDAYEELPVNFRPPIAEGAEPRRLNPLPDVVLQILHDGTVRAGREKEQLNVCVKCGCGRVGPHGVVDGDGYVCLL